MWNSRAAMLTTTIVALLVAAWSGLSLITSGVSAVGNSVSKLGTGTTTTGLYATTTTTTSRWGGFFPTEDTTTTRTWPTRTTTTDETTTTTTTRPAYSPSYTSEWKQTPGYQEWFLGGFATEGKCEATIRKVLADDPFPYPSSFPSGYRAKLGCYLYDSSQYNGAGYYIQMVPKQ